MNLSDVLGYIGLVGALGSYWLGTTNRWSFDSVGYQITQLVCCVVMFTTAAMIGFVPYCLFNLIWFSIALWKLIKIVRGSNAQDIDYDEGFTIVRQEYVG